MHSLIFQISNCPIVEDNYIGIDHVEAGEMASIDYCDEVEQSERKSVIDNLVNRTLPASMFTINPDGESLTYGGDFTEWCRQYVRSLHDKAMAINEANVFKYIGAAFQLQKAIVNPLATDILFVTDLTEGMGTAERSRQLMRIIGELQIGAKLYIGAILTITADTYDYEIYCRKNPDMGVMLSH